MSKFILVGYHLYKHSQGSIPGPGRHHSPSSHDLGAHLAAKYQGDSVCGFYMISEYCDIPESIISILHAIANLSGSNAFSGLVPPIISFPDDT